MLIKLHHRDWNAEQNGTPYVPKLILVNPDKIEYIGDRYINFNRGGVHIIETEEQVLEILEKFSVFQEFLNR